jgi:hypothetical protein
MQILFAELQQLLKIISLEANYKTFSELVVKNNFSHMFFGIQAG